MKLQRWGLLPDWVQLWPNPDSPVCVRGCVGEQWRASRLSLGLFQMAARVEIKKKKNTQLVEHVCQINETNTNKTSRTFNTT